MTTTVDEVTARKKKPERSAEAAAVELVPDQKDKRMTGRSGERRATSTKPAAAKVEA